MKETAKRIMTIILTMAMLIGVAPLTGLAELDLSGTKAAAVSTAKVGDIINFGSYPQSQVTNSGTISALDACSKTWNSYGYYTGTGSWADGNMTASDYMKYSDFMYKGTKYRAVTFSQYRPCKTSYTSSSSNSEQDDNGYTPGQIYYFNYEPLQWRVLDPATGYIMCNSIIDSQAYQNCIYDNGSEYYNSKTCKNYASDWATNSIRTWLNNDFYNTAFTASEQTKILSTKNENKSPYLNTYNSVTTDKVFLLSCYDALNTSYGFSSSTRTMKGSAYAKCQGLWVYRSSGSSYNGNSWWWLRSPYSSYNATDFYYGGNAYGGDDVDFTSEGIVPALKISDQTSETDKTENTSSKENSNTVAASEVDSMRNKQTIKMTGVILIVAVSIIAAGCIAVAIYIIVKKKH